MNNIPIELDLQIQEVQTNLVATFRKHAELSKEFSDALYFIDFTPENSVNVKSFVNGLNMLRASLNSLVEATELVAEIRDIPIH